MKAFNKCTKSNDENDCNDSLYSVKPKSDFRNVLPSLLSISKRKKKKKNVTDSQVSSFSVSPTHTKVDKNGGLKSVSPQKPIDNDTFCKLNGKRKLDPASSSQNQPNKLYRLLKSKSINAVSNFKNRNSFKNTDSVPKSSSLNQSISEQRKCLPVFAIRNNLIIQVKKYTTLIFIGETACGKTTQIPQFLHEAQLEGDGIIGITQPRRVAAVTIAERVAQETGTELGQLIGYSVRFDDTTSESTKIKYMTDGMLLREAILDPLLRKYSILILDEAHERTIHTDVLFGIVKHAQKCRMNTNPLKVIIMSATMDVDHFSRYFNNAPVFYLEGRQYSVQINNLEEPEADYVYTALRAAFQIHQLQELGDILIFCTGQEEIEAMSKTIREASKHLTSGMSIWTVPISYLKLPDSKFVSKFSALFYYLDKKKVQVCPLYAALPSAIQLKVFQPTLEGHRKIILATNIAETSLTIPGIKYVIDTGKVKARIYNPATGLNLLKIQNISQAQAWQRAGRAGRQSSGKCFRLYTEKEYAAMRLQSIPEIQRCNLSSVVLELVAVGVKNVVNFDFMDKPSPKAIENAICDLQHLGALEEGKHPKLTVLGRKMANFPLEPVFAKVILASKELGCTEEILSIISMLSVESIFFSPTQEREQAHEVRKRYSSSEGDLIMLLNVFRIYKSVNRKKEWCTENFIHHRNIKMANEVRKQLAEVCQRVKIPLKSCGQDTTAIRKCISLGMFKNAAELCSNGTYLAMDSGQKATIHPSSCLFKCKPSYVIFTEMVKTSKSYIRDLCVVDPDWLHEAAPSYFRNKLLSTLSTKS